MQALSGVDGAFLHLETEATPMHVASLHVLELPAGYRGDFVAEVRRMMRARLHLAPLLTRRLAPMPLHFANPVWVQADEVDLTHHVQHLRLPRPGTLAQLEDLTARLHGQRLDRDRPLWQLVVIDGLRGGRVGYYFKVHHAVLDGQAGVLLSQALFDLTPTPRRVPRKAAPPGEHPGALERASAALAHDAGQIVKLVRHLPEVVRTVAGLAGSGGEREGNGRGRGTAELRRNLAFGPRTPLNVPISGARSFAAASIPIATLKALAEAGEATLNDIVLALCAGALRAYLADRDALPRRPLIASMPISLRAAGNTEYTTQATLSLVNLNTHLADPVRRLRAIRDAAGATKALARRAKTVIPTDFPSIGLPWVLRGLAEAYGRSGLTRVLTPLANVVISNVPGPPMPLYAAGARVTSYWPLSVVEHGVALNITVMSYAGAMGFGFTAARNAVPDARALAAALKSSLAELKASLGCRRGGRPAAAARSRVPSKPGRP